MSDRMTDERETATLDKLYLEWSQFTTAKTARDLENEKRITELEAEVHAGYEAGWHALRQERDNLKKQLEAVNRIVRECARAGSDDAIDWMTEIMAAIGEGEDE